MPLTPLELKKKKQEVSKQQAMEREQRAKKRELAVDKMTVQVTERKGIGRRVQFNYEDCTSRTEQHSRLDTDLNYLISKMAPDELGGYIAARTQHRTEILGHDFTEEDRKSTRLNSSHT